MSAIRNFYQVTPLLACSGQPSEEQFQKIADQGYKVVVNLGLSGQEYSLTDEQRSVTQLGMQYHAIPVLFDSPNLDQFQEFKEIISRSSHQKTLVHCAANYRAITFVGLYRYFAGELDEAGLHSFISEIWNPNPVWSSFIEEAKESLGDQV